MAELAIFGAASSRQWFELGGLEFWAKPITVEQWGVMMTLSPAEESAWMAARLRERVKTPEVDASSITGTWYDDEMPFDEHATLGGYLRGEFPAHSTGKGHRLARFSAGESEDTVSVNGVRVMVGRFTRAELLAYRQLPPTRAARTAFFTTCIRKRVTGSTDPALVTPEWYGGIPASAEVALEHLLVTGRLPGTPEPPAEAKKKAE